MKQTISAKVDDDLFEIMNEICNYRKVSRNDLIVNSIKHYIISSFIEGILNLEEPNTKTKIYASTTEEQSGNQPQTHIGWGES